MSTESMWKIICFYGWEYLCKSWGVKVCNVPVWIGNSCLNIIIKILHLKMHQMIHEMP